MKKIIYLIAIILFLGISAVIYSDFRTFTKKKALYNESFRIKEIISKYDTILIQADDIQRKVEILTHMDIDDNALRAILKESERYLTRAENIKAKHMALLKEYHVIIKQFDSLPHQKLLFSGNLPNTINERTQHMPSAGR